MSEAAAVTRIGLASCQCCVPADWPDAQAEEFANTTLPTGIDSPWRMRHTGDEALRGASERVPCEMRPGFVHIMFDC